MKTAEATLAEAKAEVITELEATREHLSYLSKTIVAIPEHYYGDDPYSMSSYPKAEEHVAGAWRAIGYALQTLQGK